MIPIASDGSFIKAGLPPARYTLHLMDGGKTLARADLADRPGGEPGKAFALHLIFAVFLKGLQN